MNCEQVQAMLVTYLDSEVTPSERVLILAHLTGCTVCQQELDLLSTARSQVRSALQRHAIQAVPSREAWNRLEARLSKMQVSFLPEAAQPASIQYITRRSHRISGVSRFIYRLFSGDTTMRKRYILGTIMAVLAIAMVTVLVFNNVVPVSAQTILDRAYAAQSIQNEGEGIQHMRVETYQNFCARPEGAPFATVMESYLDLQTGYFRTVTTESETGNVLEVAGFDGAFVYSGHRSVEVKSEQPAQGSEPGPKHVICDQPWGSADALLTVYRGAQSSVAGVNLPMSEGQQTYEEIFEKMRNDPDAELLGEETWIDGRTVFVLRSWQPVKVVIEGSTELPMGWVMSYFDTESYKIVESRATIDRDGQELLVYSYRVLADEILPVGNDQNWDLSDLEGITIVDDPEHQYVDPLPEVISEEELAQTQSAYLLNSIPEGFALEISASRKQPVDQPFIYVASYRNEANDYFVIQSIGSKETKFMGEPTDETYSTASGLVISFMNNIKDPSAKEFTSAVVETPEGTVFILNSTLPREEVKALTEHLALISE